MTELVNDQLKVISIEELLRSISLQRKNIFSWDFFFKESSWLALFNHLKIANFEKLWFFTLDDTLSSFIQRFHWIMLRCNSTTLGHRRSIFQVQFYGFPETIRGVWQLTQVKQTRRSDIQKGTTTECLLQWTCGIIMLSLPSYANLQNI